MIRLLALGIVVLLVVPSLPWAAPAPAPRAAVLDRLGKTADFKGFDDPKTTLVEALEQLGKLYDVSFEINEKAFKYEQLNDVAKAEIAQPMPILALHQARLDRVLRRILARIAVPSGATYLVRPDYLEITTESAAAAEVYGNISKSPGPRLPLVHLDLKRQPLHEALTELAGQSDFNILLDNRAEEQGKTPVTARLRNAPLDSAVRLLADMADLRAVHLDNMLYVTTRENAAALEARLNKDFTPDPMAEDNGSGGPAGPPRKGGSRVAPSSSGGPGA